MSKEQLKEILIDLYTLYNPDKLSYVDVLVEKFKDTSFDLIDNILITYNNENLPYFDPQKSTSDYRWYLIKEYKKGNRVLQNSSLQEEIKKAKDQKAEEKSKIEKKEVEEKEKLEQKTLIQTSVYDVTFQINYTEENIIIPKNKNELFFVSKGSRIILPNEHNKPVGLEVIDIVIDMWSMEQISVLIILDKK